MMPRKISGIDFTKPETIISLQRSSISAGGSSVNDQLNKQSPSTSSFRYLAPGSPLKSTQQLPIDWSDFSKHTFFSSAVANCNVAFDTIINNFPFDGTFREIEDFFDNLSGFESYIYNKFTKSLNSLAFSASSYIEVIDSAGSKFPELSKNKTGASVLDPGATSISFQFKLFVPEQLNENQIIAQRILSDSGYTLAVSKSLSTDTADFLFAYTSGSTALYVTSSFNKGEWVDLTAMFNRRPGINKLQLYVTGNLVASSNSVSEFEVFTSLGSPLYIGSGSYHSCSGFSFEPKTTLSASLDDFKIFIGNRTQEDVKFISNNPTEPRQDLRLYFKFNEPSGSYERNSFVIDASGNGLHSTITNFRLSLKDSIANSGGPASFGEREAYNPVLFPDYPDLVTLNSDLIDSATDYDSNNPNYIVKLIPSHYLEEEQSEMGLTSVDGDIGRSFAEGGSLPRATKLGSVQLITSMLLIWAKQFDEMKMFIDQMSKLNSVDYNEINGIADTFLPFFAKEYGIELPRLFSDPDYLQYFHGDNLTQDGSIGTNPLYQIEAIMWRRILASMPNIIKSKGTIDSVKSIIRSVGIDPDVTLRFKEYGGSRSGFIVGRNSVKKTLKFSTTGSFKITSPFLSGSRSEPGHPLVAGNSSDGLFTTSSFSLEGHYLFPRGDLVDNSLMKVISTGSYGKGCMLNLILEKSGTISGEWANLTLSGAYSTNSSQPERFSISLGNLPIYDSPFYVSFGREKQSSTTSNWFLRFGKSIGQTLILTESFATVTVPEQYDNFSNISATYNSSGSWFEIGNSTILDGATTLFLNDSTLGQKAKTNRLTGKVSQIRMWSKFLSGSEWQEHVRNPLSVGVSHPSLNYNFVTAESGSFERLRIDAGLDQQITSSDGLGQIDFVDFTQNNLSLVGSGFEANANVITSFDVIYNAINSNFDESSTDEKIRVRSWKEKENYDIYGGSNLPVYLVDQSETPIDDNRFGIEISTSKALNDDIVLLFGGHEAIDEIYGNTSDLFSESYSGERHLREVYFNRLTDSVSYKNIFLFSKWFESNIERLVQQIIPYNTNFAGVNLVVESHMLERNKIKYGWADIYLDESSRKSLRGSIGTSLITAEVKKF